MTIKTRFAILFLVISSACYGQEISLGLGYSNLHSRQFDNLIQTYNFSRPFLQEKQPLLSHGISSHLSYIFKSEKNLKSGISVGYSFFTSRARNENHNSKFSFNMLELGYVLYFKNKDKLDNFYGEFGLNTALGLLNKKLDTKPYAIDNTKVRSFHAGASLNLNIGYVFDLSDRLKISPIVGIHYSPYFWEGQSEIVINQTSGLIDEQYTSFLKFDIGFRIHITNKKVANNI